MPVDVEGADRAPSTVGKEQPVIVEVGEHLDDQVHAFASLVSLFELDEEVRSATQDGALPALEHRRLAALDVDLDEADVLQVEVVEASDSHLLERPCRLACS